MQIAPESIFVSSLRTFCRMFFGITAALIAIALFSMIYSSIASPPLIDTHTQLEILPDAKGTRELVGVNAPAILQIPIHGVIGDPQALDAVIIENILLDSRIGLLDHDRVKGILLHFNTPGGTVVDSDSIYQMLKMYKEKFSVPIFAYVEGMCASGGMYVACAADQIFAGPASVIGSVGVIIGPFFNIYDFMGKVGLQARTLTQGLDKDMMNPTRPWKEGEDNSLKAVTAFMYNHFVSVVTNARPDIDRDLLINQYGAQVFDCVTAQRFGYIDTPMSSRNEALLALLKKANIDPEQPYQVVALTPKHSWVADLVSGKSPLLSGKIEHALNVGQPPIKEQISYLYQPGAHQ